MSNKRMPQGIEENLLKLSSDGARARARAIYGLVRKVEAPTQLVEKQFLL